MIKYFSNVVKHTIYVVLLIIVAGCNNDNKKQEVTLPDEIIKESQDIENYVPKKNISEIKTRNIISQKQYSEDLIPKKYHKSDIIS